MRRAWTLLVVLALNPVAAFALEVAKDLEASDQAQWVLQLLGSPQRAQLLSALPAERRSRMEQRLKALDGLSPEAQGRLRRQYQQFLKWTPRQRRELRAIYRRYRELPADRRVLLQRELRRLRQLPLDSRMRRLQSPRMRQQFSQEELDLLRRVAEILPPPVPAKLAGQPQG